MKRKISLPSKLTSAPVNLSQMAAHPAKPANRPSCSTSCEAGVSPSAPRAPGNSSIVDATVLATAQAKMEPPPQAPSLLGTSPHQVSLTSCLGSGQLRNKLLHLLRPPTPDFDAQAGSAVAAQQLRVRALLPSTCFHATPSIRSALRLAVPLEWMARHEGGIHCQLPPKRSRPSTTTSSLQASTMPGWIRSKSLIITFRGDSSTSFPTNPRHSTLQGPPSTRQDTCPRARCSVVATRVKWTATPAGTRSQGEGKTKSAKEDHPEQLRWDLRESTRRARGQCQPSSRPSLGPDHGHPGCVNSCEDVTVPEVRFNTRSFLMLPANPCSIRARSLPVHGMLV